MTCKPIADEIKENVKYDEQYGSCNNLTYGSIDSLVKNHLLDETDPEIIKIINFLKNILNINYIRGPPVDFAIYEFYEKTVPHQEIIISNFNNFYKKILPFSLENGIIPKTNPDISILCISHGSAMRGFFKKRYGGDVPHPLNTQIFREKILCTTNKIFMIKPVSIDYMQYVPTIIRTKYENFEALNIDVCRVESLKGIINYPLYDPALTDKIVPSFNFPFFGSKSTNPSDYATNDVKFYFNNTSKYYNDTIKNSAIIKGGNNNYLRYLKYKAKYLALKKQNQLH